ncbi:MAG TPA: hypothetical protein VJT75_01215 [Thermoleophilaceae bacterium]|nr:hypothetical protein [Thermoleophilaceae bacterium]
MRRRLALLALAAMLLAAPGTAAAAERVSVKPHAGDVNTRFVYRGSGWRPNARVSYTHGALCGTGLCILPLYFRVFESDANGEFEVSERPTKYVPRDFVGYTLCFGYPKREEGPPNAPCEVRAQISLAPPSASATPALAERSRGDSLPTTVTLAARHFKAGTRLRIHVRYPGGRHRVLKTRARRRGAYVGPGHAYTPRGGATRLLDVRKDDPDGTYRVRIVDRRGNEALTSFVAQQYHDF